MSVRELEAAVSNVSREELAAFRKWFVEFDAELWDRQFEEDVAGGRLDKLTEEAISDLKEGRTIQRSKSVTQSAREKTVMENGVVPFKTCSPLAVPFSGRALHQRHPCEGHPRTDVGNY